MLLRSQACRNRMDRLRLRDRYMTEINTPTIAGFEILKKLGQGGMATVWMARQISLDRVVAIKVLLPRFAVDDEEIARFRSEAQAAARLKHPGIVQVYDASVTDGSYYFIMEYIAGYTVGEWLRRKATLPERDALVVAEHVCDALGYAWDHAKVIHCDIKPDNVMIDDDGTVKVMDLGLARTLNAMSSFVEDDEHVLGTPSYMSPEQARGDAHLDFRSDIYSLGAMLYHLVTGKRLFSETDENTALEMQITGCAPDPIDLNPALSRPLCALIERMLAKNPDLRGESWQSVHADMRRVYSGLTPHQTLHADEMSTIQRSERRAPVDTERLKRLTKNNTRLSLPGAVWATLWTAIAAVAIAAAVRFYLGLASHTPPPVQPAPPPARPTATPRQQPPQGPATGAVSDINESPEEKLYQAAVAWQRANPADPDGAIALYEKVIQAARGTSYERRAEASITLLKAERRQTRQQQVDALQKRLNGHKEAGEYAQAEALVAAYAGDLPEDTAFRERMRQDIQRHRQARESQARLEDRKRQEQLAKEIMTPVLQLAAKAIVQGNLQRAIDLTRPLREQQSISYYHDALSELETELEVLINLDSWILETFRQQEGQTIEVSLNSQTVLLTIGILQDGQLQCFQQTGDGEFEEIHITLQDLTQQERLARLSTEQPGAAAVARGMMACKAGAYLQASTHFKNAHFLIASPLSQAADEVSQSQ